MLKPRDKNKPKNTGISFLETFDEAPSEIIVTKEEIRTFRDQAIKVLNELEKEDINIYDNSRKPGMYLRKRWERYYGVVPSETEEKLINHIFNEDSEEKIEKSSEEELPEGLKKLFKQ